MIPLSFVTATRTVIAFLRSPVSPSLMSYDQRSPTRIPPGSGARAAQSPGRKKTKLDDNEGSEHRNLTIHVQDRRSRAADTPLDIPIASRGKQMCQGANHRRMTGARLESPGLGAGSMSSGATVFGNNRSVPLCSNCVADLRPGACRSCVPSD